MHDDIRLLEDKMNDHILQDAVWKKEHEERWHQNDVMVKEVIVATKENAKHIGENTAQIKQVNTNIQQLTDESRGVINLYKDVNSTITVFKYAQKGALWLVKWGAVVTFFTAAAAFLKESGVF